MCGLCCISVTFDVVFDFEWFRMVSEMYNVFLHLCGFGALKLIFGGGLWSNVPAYPLLTHHLGLSTG